MEFTINILKREIRSLEDEKERINSSSFKDLTGNFSNELSRAILRIDRYIKEIEESIKHLENLEL